MKWTTQDASVWYLKGNHASHITRQKAKPRILSRFFMQATKVAFPGPHCFVHLKRGLIIHHMISLWFVCDIIHKSYMLDVEHEIKHAKWLKWFDPMDWMRGHTQSHVHPFQSSLCFTSWEFLRLPSWARPGLFQGLVSVSKLDSSAWLGRLLSREPWASLTEYFQLYSVWLI